VGGVDLNPYHHLLSRDVKLMASSGYSAVSFRKALQLTEELASPLGQLVTHVLPLSRTLDAITALTPEQGWKLDGREAGKITLDPWA
jgi:threonine dehydrogenase-like Zn-dependent dehydrogenase